MPRAAASRGLRMRTGLPSQIISSVGLVDAGHAFDERGLAGAVIAHEGSHLSSWNVEIDAVEGPDRPEVLFYATDAEQRPGPAGLIGHLRHLTPVLVGNARGRAPAREITGAEPLGID